VVDPRKSKLTRPQPESLVAGDCHRDGHMMRQDGKRRNHNRGVKRAAENVTVPVPLPARTPEEESVLAEWKHRPRLQRPPSFNKEGETLVPNGDRDLAYARMGAILHTSSQFHTAVTLEPVAYALGKTESEESVNAALAMIHGIGPRDHMETLLASQMAATHVAALEMLRRAQIKEQPSEVVDSCVTRATRLMRTFTAQVTALRDYRNRGQQTVTVQHVDVREGGQAIVGRAVTLQPPQGGGGSHARK
jgi:hypothetical protein